MNIKIKADIFAAVSLFRGINDVRYYLNGMLLETGKSGAAEDNHDPNDRKHGASSSHWSRIVGRARRCRLRRLTRVRRFHFSQKRFQVLARGGHCVSDLCFNQETVAPPQNFRMAQQVPQDVRRHGRHHWTGRGQHRQKLVLFPAPQEVFRIQAVAQGMRRGAQKRLHRLRTVFSAKLLQPQHPYAQQPEAAVRFLQARHAFVQHRARQPARRNSRRCVQTTGHRRPRRVLAAHIRLFRPRPAVSGRESGRAAVRPQLARRR